jgi:hypothetical protein
MAETRIVRDAAGLNSALDESAPIVEVSGSIAGSPGITLPPGVTWVGDDEIVILASSLGLHQGRFATSSAVGAEGRGSAGSPPVAGVGAA